MPGGTWIRTALVCAGPLAFSLGCAKAVPKATAFHYRSQAQEVPLGKAWRGTLRADGKSDRYAAAMQVRLATRSVLGVRSTFNGPLSGVASLSLYPDGGNKALIDTRAADQPDVIITDALDPGLYFVVVKVPPTESGSTNFEVEVDSVDTEPSH